MNKSQLIALLAQRTGIPKAQAARAVDVLFAPSGIIAGELTKGAKVQITGFGNFEVRTRGPRKGRDPRNGGEITIGPSVAAVFRAGRPLSEALGKKKKKAR